MAQAAPIGFASGDWAQLDKGQIVTTTGTKQGNFHLYQVAGHIDGGPQRVYRMLTDFNNHASIFSQVKTSSIKKQVNPTTILVHKDLNLPWPMTGKWNLSQTTVRPDIHGYEFESIDGNVGKQKGRYETFERKGKTVVLYQIWYDLSTNPMPKALFDQAQRVALPGILQDLRKAISRY